MQDIECHPYAPVLMESTRAIGYSTEAAIADIIDNSIAAEADSINIMFDYYPTPYVAILDNGVGMNSMRITEAMRYGTVSPSEQRTSNDLGRYGLGMKTASLSQCRQLTVISKQGDHYEGRQWDLDHILETKEWSLIELTYDEMNLFPHFIDLFALDNGTLVVWQKLDKIKLGTVSPDKALAEKMNSVKSHLELVFHRFLSGDGGKKLRMSINGVNLVPFDPFFTTKSTVVMDDEIIEIPGRSGKVVIRPYILPHPSKMSKDELDKYGGKDGLRGLQGFYIYRNRRLLTWGTWFKLRKMDEFTKLARVRVDIPNSLDDLWTLDIKKSTAFPPDIVKTRLKQLINTLSEGSVRTWKFRKRKESDKNYIHIWDKTESREGVKYEINMDHPILKEIDGKLDDSTRTLLKNYLEIVQNNLPFNNLYTDLNSDVKIIKDKDDEERKKVMYLAKSLFKDKVKSDGEADELLKQLEHIDPFSFYVDEIKAAYTEVLRNG